MRVFAVCSLLGCLWLAGCTGDDLSLPVDPGAPRPDLMAHAFRITVDLSSGKAEVSPPGEAAAARPDGGPSFSLIGKDGIEISIQGGTCTPLSSSRPRQKRCALRMEIENQLSSTDFVTPTDFPKPPVGTTGLLVFPISAAAGGSTLSTIAIPSPDWDMAPINFFNDVGSCSSGSKSDCYRYEVFQSPLYARNSQTRTIGFDIPADATSVTASVIVAADLRDNPLRTARLAITDELCGTVSTFGEITLGDNPLLIGARLIGEDIHRYRSFCSFHNSLPQVDLRISTAKLRIYTGRDQDGEPYVEPLPFGATIDGGDYGLPSIATLREMTRTADDREVQYEGSLTSEIQRASDARDAEFQFRIGAKNEGDTFNAFHGPEAFRRPELEITYLLK